MPGEVTSETYWFYISQDWKPASYRLKIRLAENRKGTIRPIELALKEEIRDGNGYYALSAANIN
jgi:hypothetical protein